MGRVRLVVVLPILASTIAALEIFRHASVSNSRCREFYDLYGVREAHEVASLNSCFVRCAKLGQRCHWLEHDPVSRLCSLVLLTNGSNASDVAPADSRFEASFHLPVGAHYTDRSAHLTTCPPCRAAGSPYNVACPAVSFNRSWSEYEAGFGDPSENFWLGECGLGEGVMELARSLPSGFQVCPRCIL